jgi:hypothetical protein
LASQSQTVRMRPRVTAIFAGGRDAREISLAGSRYICEPLLPAIPPPPQPSRASSNSPIGESSAHQPRSRVAGQQTNDERDRANFLTARAAVILKSETP